MNECQPERGEQTAIPCARPPDTFKQIWRAVKCHTVECPPGFIGGPITRCAEATSEISQADADAKALAAAIALAEADLVCLKLTALEERALLDIGLETGVYQAEALEELGTLDITMFGEYFIPPYEELGLLNINLAEGEYLLIPFEEPITWSISLYPLSEYRLQPHTDHANFHTGLGPSSYFLGVVPGAEYDELGLLRFGLNSGNYSSPVISTTHSAEGTMDVDTSGAYTLKVIAAPDQAENGSLDLTLNTGNYFFQIIYHPLFPEINSLSIGLAAGSYA